MSTRAKQSISLVLVVASLLPRMKLGIRSGKSSRERVTLVPWLMIESDSTPFSKQVYDSDLHYCSD